MSIKVNLLPREIEEKNRQRRQLFVAVAAAIAFVAVLVAGYLWQVGQVNDAKDRLTVEEQERDRIRGEVNRLAEFAQLQTEVDDLNGRVASLLAGEVSFAGILQDIATVMPSDAALTTLSITAGAESGSARVGTVTSTGTSLNGHAPGLERLLIAFEKATSFSNLFFSSSTLGEDGRATFSFTFDLGPEVLTRRYVNGVPEELR